MCFGLFVLVAPPYASLLREIDQFVKAAQHFGSSQILFAPIYAREKVFVRRARSVLPGSLHLPSRQSFTFARGRVRATNINIFLQPSVNQGASIEVKYNASRVETSPPELLDSYRLCWRSLERWHGAYAKLRSVVYKNAILSDLSGQAPPRYQRL